MSWRANSPSTALRELRRAGPLATNLIRSVPKQKIDRLLEQQAIPRMGRSTNVANTVDFFLGRRAGSSPARPFTWAGLIHAFPRYLMNVLRANPEKDAVIWRGRAFRYAWLCEAVSRWDSLLEDSGVKPGSVVSVEADFSPTPSACCWP